MAGHPVHGAVVVAGEIAGSRPLDLDHPGAEVGELAGGQRHGHRLLQRDDGDSRKRKHRARITRVPPARKLGWCESRVGGVGQSSGQDRRAGAVLR